MQSIGMTIRRLRKERNITQEGLSEAVGVTPQAVSKWEMGASVPDLDNILKMSELFACSTDHLLKEEDFKPSTNAKTIKRR